MELYYFLLIIYFLLFLFLAIRYLKWAVYLIIFSLPAYLIRFQLGGLPTTLLEIMIGVVFLVWVFRNIAIEEYRNIKILKQKINKILGYWDIRIFIILVGVFLLAATVAIFVAPELKAAAGIWKAYFVEPILFLIVFASLIKKEDLKNIFGVLGLSVLFLGFLAIYQKITGGLITNPFWAAEETRRVTGVFPYPNALALYLAPIVVMFLGYVVLSIKYLPVRASQWQAGQIFKKVNIKNLLVVSCWLLAVGLSLVAVYFTKSKGALLAILMGVIFYALFYRSYRKYFIGLLIIVILLLGYFINLGKLDLRGVGTVEGGDSITTRVEMWQETWQMLKNRPVLGAGLSGYQSAVVPYHQKEYIEIYLYPHNIILNFWAELGLIGLIGFLGIVGWFYCVGFRLLSYDKRFMTNNLRQANKLSAVSCQLSVVLMAGMTTLLVHGLVDVPYFKNDLAVLFWLIIGLMIILRQEGISLPDANRV